ncbi:chromodomain Y-like protein isoform X1 [Hippoglossus hippoglossus]|uniref:chromodomain Y-like protein isoform X1 n=2 Tax=Hippoglossus hippoglossus TaxID=8267 RepID=UPI00148D61BE|nr:chromodomain Y-like protein isoform X1 [Hippoglossus hippoglossus]XP_035025574.1 chromodomain Y-like protein isoform X1 [Hippoglossus stenolepis]
MATEEFYEVERIIDKRKNKKMKLEYLVRWRGYGSEEDTWEPESHLSTCMIYVHEFNRQNAVREKDSTLLRSTRSSPSLHYISAHRPPFRPPITATAHSDISVVLTADCNQVSPAHLPPVGLTSPASVGSRQPLLADRFSSGLMSAAPACSARRSVDLSKTGIKILVPKSPMNSRLDSEESPSEAAHSLEAGPQEAHQVPPEVALLEKPAGVQLGPGEERARMGTRPRSQNPLPPPRVPITPAAMRSLSGTGNAALMEAVAANGMSGGQSAVAGATSVTGKRRLEERSAFDKRLRFSVRQTESAYRYRDIVVKKQDGFTHILLSTKSSENNTLNPEVMKEIQSAMATAASDDSKLVLVSAVGSVFCCGLDFLYFIRQLTDDRKKESIKMAETIRTFVNTFIQFRKPIVAAVNGPALGLGAAILPLCDVVWANEKAWFQTPYTSYGQTPDACSSFTFPRIMGLASANELLLSGRKLTAQEACCKGLVSQVLWPGTFTQEVMLRIKELVTVDSLVLRESKALMRNTSRSALEQANERECEALKRVWGSSQGTDSILQFLQRRTELC